jgi:polysaccharide biosynthesis transport protein
LGNELRSMIRVARHWWWLLLIAPIVGGVLGDVLSSRQQPLYASTAQIVMSPIAGDTSIDYSTTQGVLDLAGTWKQLMTTDPVLEPVIKNLNLPYGVDELRSKLTTSLIPSTLILTVTASDENADEAARIANGVAQQFQTNMTLPSKSANVNMALAVPAVASKSPYAPRVPIYIALGGLLAFLAACAVIAFFEFLDKSIKDPTDAVTLVERPLLAVLPYDRKIKRNPASYMPVLVDSSDPFAEAVRQLRTRILSAKRTHSKLSIAILSPQDGEGKTTVAANLAVSLANAGYSVAIIDADLRKPNLHERFQVINDRGLSTLLVNPEQDWQTVTANVKVKNLKLIPSGPVVEDAIDLLDGGRLHSLLADISDSTDIVLIDTPSLLKYSDALSIAKEMDGSILICRAGSTTRDDLVTTATSLREAGIWLAGIVMNNQKSVRRNPILLSDKQEDVPELAERRARNDEPAMKSMYPQ